MNKETKVKITKAGYVYVAGVKLNTRPLTPFYRAAELIEDKEIQAVVNEWISKKWRMVNN